MNSFLRYLTSQAFLLSWAKTTLYQLIELGNAIFVYFFYKSMFEAIVPNLKYSTTKKYRVYKFIIMLFAFFFVSAMIQYVESNYFSDLTPEAIKISTAYGFDVVIALLILKNMKLEYGAVQVELPQDVDLEAATK
ncbi:hypothetical protein C6P40_001627 [Pichia californica]|uniref:Uncharacterized protein n=1 Tax=Pichia californica TaxID=460514 RepID=A0A9P6WRS0_9ASCO|nr:hypothetical protein C6P42_000024 [[Candida] californica]KAG0691343.1 hypothetical protein C6P40_001627 [[Candida] californica]